MKIGLVVWAIVNLCILALIAWGIWFTGSLWFLLGLICLFNFTPEKFGKEDK